MEITVKTTGRYASVNGHPRPIWEGTDEAGRPVWVLVHRIGMGPFPARPDGTYHVWAGVEVEDVRPLEEGGGTRP